MATAAAFQNRTTARNRRFHHKGTKDTKTLTADEHGLTQINTANKHALRTTPQLHPSLPLHPFDALDACSGQAFHLSLFTYLSDVVPREQIYLNPERA